MHIASSCSLMIQAASLGAKAVRSDSSRSRVRHYEAAGIALLQICALGSKTVHRGSKGTGLRSGKVEFC